jgi:hypothetical protein
MIYACTETNSMHYLSSVYSVTLSLYVSGLLLAPSSGGDNVYMRRLVRAVRLSRLSAGLSCPPYFPRLHAFSTHIMFIAFLRQHWLRERGLILRYNLPILFNFIYLTLWSVRNGSEDVALDRIHGDRKYGTTRRSGARRGCLLSIYLKKSQLSWKFLWRRDFIGSIRKLFTSFEVFVFLVSDAASIRDRFLTFRKNVVSVQ